MNRNTSTANSLYNTNSFYSSDGLKQKSQLLMLLMETERTFHRDPDIASAYLDKAIALLAVDVKSEPLPRKIRGGLLRWQILRVDKYINEHLDHCIRTTELASLFGLSVSHFSRAFKHTTGVTPQKYVTTARVVAARKQMLCSKLSLSEIALIHGFCDQSHFCRAFRLETGMSPQSWRKPHIASPQSAAAFNANSSQQAA